MPFDWYVTTDYNYNDIGSSFSVRCNFLSSLCDFIWFWDWDLFSDRLACMSLCTLSMLFQLLSQYFDKKSSTSLPIWNGTSQFGDCLALFISDIVIQGLNADVSITLLIISVIMVVVFILNVIYLPKDKRTVETEDIPKDIN